MNEYSYDYIFKLILIGAPYSGKTSIIIRFCDSQYTPSYTSTIGIDFKIKTLTVAGKCIKIQLWDTAGQERYQALTKSHYKGSMGCICVYDISNKTSF